jgi:hypothetical protein
MKQFNIDFCEYPLDMTILEQYKDLLYCRLALPEVPNIDNKKLEAYIQETNASYVKTYLDYAGSDRFAKQANVNYPWKTAWIRSRIHNNWVNDFDKKFPELVNYLTKFPIDSLEDFAAGQFLAQKENIEAFPHTDPDPYFGFRVYLSEEESRSNLYFHPSYNPIEQRPHTFVTIDGVTKANDLTEFYDHNNKIIVKNNFGKFPFMINSVRGCHGIEKNVNRECDRIVLLLFFKKINSKKLKELFDKSIELYPEEAIWRK